MSLTRILHGALALAVVVAAAAALGCGSADEPSGPAPAAAAAGTTVQVEVEAHGTPAFVQRTLTAPSGEITVAFTNRSTVPRTLAIAGHGVRAGPTTSVRDGYTAELAVDLAPGSYTYSSAAPGGEEPDLTGTLTVR